jgi:hypothetical protein
LGPYKIDACYENGLVKIKTIDEEMIPVLVNGYTLKIYRKPMKRKELSSLIQRKQLNVVGSINSLIPF